MGRPLRIALVVERYGAGGGVEGVARNVATGLAAAGETVHVFCRVVEAEPPAGHPAPVLHALGGPSAWQPLRVLAFSWAAGRATRQGFDVVHSFSRTRHQQVYRAGGGSHAAYLERAHAPLAARLRRVSPRHAVLLELERRIFGDPRQLVLCNSAMVEREVRARYRVPAERLVVIPNGVDLERIDAARRDESRRAALRAALGAETGPVWLLVGSGFRRKGVATALRALAACEDTTAQLWVAGRDDPAPWRKLATALAVAGRVRWLGARDDVPELLAAADGFLLPTRYDACSNACLEAAAAGLPVVTSGANGAADLLADGAHVVENPEDAPGFARALDFLATAGARSRVGAAARARAETLSWERHVEALRSLYRERVA